VWHVHAEFEKAVELPLASKWLWKSSILPGPSIRALPYKTGYWSPHPSFDFLPQEPLIFGLSETELRTLIRFSACVRPGGTVSGGPDFRTRTFYDMTGFRVHFVNGSSKAIGECVEEFMKDFDIDGPNGEHIITLEVGMNELPKQIKVNSSTPLYGIQH
jgi:hypothetical protein